MAEVPTDVRVLLAEEQSLFRESIRLALESEPDITVVAVADSGLRAVAEAERHQPDVAVLSDGLTGLDGIQVTFVIRERVPQCRILFLAGAEDQTSLMAALEAGAVGYLAKNCRLSELVDATRAIHWPCGRNGTAACAWSPGSPPGSGRSWPCSPPAGTTRPSPTPW